MSGGPWRSRHRIDAELGPVRYCPHCDEWWPDDEEFWLYYVNRAGSDNGTGYLRKSDVRIARCRGCYTGRARQNRAARGLSSSHFSQMEAANR